MPSTCPKRPHVVIVGAGFGGLWSARTLAKRNVDVTLIDRNNYHTFFPLLYQVAAAELVPTDIARPVRSIFRDADNITVLMAEMTGLNTETKSVCTTVGDVQYDAAVLALGSEPTFFGVKGAAEHAFPLRWMRDAIPLRHRVLTQFEKAKTAPPEDRARLLTFTVVGGGPTGVEYAGALSELVHGPLARDFRWVDTDDVTIILLEAGETVLAGMPESLSRYACDRLARRSVEVRTGAIAEEVGADFVRLANGDCVNTETVIWTAGVQGEPRVAEWGLPVGRAGRVPVEPTLEVVGYPDVYVVGDLAYLEDADGQPLPQIAQVAIQQGRRAAKNILGRAAGQEASVFRYKDLGMLAVIGRNAAVAHVFGRTFKGPVAWVLWLVIHITWLIGFRNRMLVLVNWGWNYIFPLRSIRLILPSDR